MGVRCGPTMFTKQVSRPVDRLDPPSWPPRRSRSSELEERPGHRPDPRFLCPTGEERPIGCAVDRALHLPAEDSELVAEHRDLDLRLGRHAILRPEQAEDALQEEIEE